MFLNDENKTKNFKFVHSIKNNIEEEQFYHLIFFINNFENAILNREFHYIKLEMRYLYEAIWNLIESGLRNRPKIQKEFGVTEFFKRNKSKRYGTLSKEKHKTFSELFKELPWRGKMDKFVYEEFRDTYKKLHKYLHYNEYTVENIRDEIRYSNITLKDAYGYGEFFFGILRWAIMQIYKIDLDGYPEEFEKKYYDNYKNLMENFIKKDGVLKIYKTNCMICDEGKIIKPIDELLPFGPYLQCDNKECNAILGQNLKLKSQKIDDEECPNEKCNGEIKEVYNYPYKNKYKSCNKCSFNTRNNLENVINLEEVKDHLNGDEKFKNIEEMYYSSIEEKEDDKN